MQHRAQGKSTKHEQGGNRKEENCGILEKKKESMPKLQPAQTNK